MSAARNRAMSQETQSTDPRRAMLLASLDHHRAELTHGVAELKAAATQPMGRVVAAHPWNWLIGAFFVGFLWGARRKSKHQDGG
jgi:hypothetical protein